MVALPRRRHLFEDTDDLLYKLAAAVDVVLFRNFPKKFFEKLDYDFDLEDVEREVGRLYEFYTDVLYDVKYLCDEFDRFYEFKETGDIDYVTKPADYLMDKYERSYEEDVDDEKIIIALYKMSKRCWEYADSCNRAWEEVNSAFRALVNKMAHCKYASEFDNVDRVKVNRKVLERIMSFEKDRVRLEDVYKEAMFCLRVVADFDRFMEMLSKTLRRDMYGSRILVPGFDDFVRYLKDMSIRVNDIYMDFKEKSIDLEGAAKSANEEAEGLRDKLEEVMSKVLDPINDCIVWLRETFSGEI